MRSNYTQHFIRIFIHSPQPISNSPSRFPQSSLNISQAHPNKSPNLTKNHQTSSNLSTIPNLILINHPTSPYLIKLLLTFSNPILCTKSPIIRAFSYLAPPDHPLITSLNIYHPLHPPPTPHNYKHCRPASYWKYIWSKLEASLRHLKQSLSILEAHF